MQLLIMQFFISILLLPASLSQTILTAWYTVLDKQHMKKGHVVSLHAIRTHRERTDIAQVFVASAPDAGEWSTSMPWLLYSWRNNPQSQWAGPRGGLHIFEGTKPLSPVGNQNPEHPAHSLDRILTMPSKLHTT